MPSKDEKWHPRFFIGKDTCMLVGNLLDFVCDNQVQVGDICIFCTTKEWGKVHIHGPYSPSISY